MVQLHEKNLHTLTAQNLILHRGKMIIFDSGDPTQTGELLSARTPSLSQNSLPRLPPSDWGWDPGSPAAHGAGCSLGWSSLRQKAVAGRPVMDTHSTVYRNEAG
jgi:hypothetical protein